MEMELLQGSSQICLRGTLWQQQRSRNPLVSSFRRRLCHRSGCCQAAANGGQPDMNALEKAMQDPKIQEQMKQYEQAMQDPKIKEQTQQLSQVMQSPVMMQRMAKLREDPELKPMFEEMQQGGMQAMMKYMNDPKWLAKVGEKLGDVDVPPDVGMAQRPPSASPAAPEITNLIEAARYGDLEAVEDFIAVGKDVNQRDRENRVAIHYAIAYKHKDIFHELLASGADLTLMDTQGNTPLHYAAGYGRGEFVKDLIDAGAKGFSKNNNGHTPCDLVRMEKKNPINGDRELMKLLEVASST